MSTLNENLNKIYECKQDIGRALIEKGVAVKGFDTYADGIRSIRTSKDDKVREWGAAFIGQFKAKPEEYDFFKTMPDLQTARCGLTGLAFSDGNKIVVLLIGYEGTVTNGKLGAPKVVPNKIPMMQFGAEYMKRYILNDTLITEMNNVVSNSFFSTKELYYMNSESYAIICSGLQRCEDPNPFYQYIFFKRGMTINLCDYIYNNSSNSLYYPVVSDITLTLPIPVDTLSASIATTSNIKFYICAEYPFKERT